MSSLTTEASDAFASACKTVIQGSYADDFTEHVNNENLVAAYSDYSEMSDEEIALAEKISALQNDYNTLCNDLGSITVTVHNKEYTFEYLLSDEAYFFSAMNPEDYAVAYDKCLAEFNRQSGEIYLQLIALLDEQAKAAGYDDYADYGDDEYNRNYDAEALEALKEATKEIAPDYALYRNTDAFSLSLSSSELVDKVGDIVCGISDLAADAYEDFTMYHLYTIGDDENRLSGAYTLDFRGAKKAVIYQKTNSTFDDLPTLTHEFGHFVYFDKYQSDATIFDNTCIDLCEIHSNGLQLLATNSFKEAYPDEADDIESYCLSSALMNVVDGCIYDDWQREIYENTAITLEEANELYIDIATEYYGDAYTGSVYKWSFISHNFTSPMYYISYATSGFSALQIWAQSLDDFDVAVDTWETIVETSNSSEGFISTIEAAGLDGFEDKSTALSVLKKAINHIKND